VPRGGSPGDSTAAGSAATAGPARRGVSDPPVASSTPVAAAAVAAIAITAVLRAVIRRQYARDEPAVPGAGLVEASRPPGVLAGFGQAVLRRHAHALLPEVGGLRVPRSRCWGAGARGTREASLAQSTVVRFAALGLIGYLHGQRLLIAPHEVIPVTPGARASTSARCCSRLCRTAA
jgi:hypothetical protein